MLFDNNDDLVSVSLEELFPIRDWGNIIVTSRDRMVLAHVGGTPMGILPEIVDKSGRVTPEGCQQIPGEFARCRLVGRPSSL
jgi:hypothetical protein